MRRLATFNLDVRCLDKRLAGLRSLCADRLLVPETASSLAPPLRSAHRLYATADALAIHYLSWSQRAMVVLVTLLSTSATTTGRGWWWRRSDGRRWWSTAIGC